MYQEEPNVAVLIAEEGGQDFALKASPLPMLSGFTQALDPVMLAGLGIYGVLSYWIKARQREIAVRVALGAQPSRILRWAGSHAGRIIALGLCAGAIGTWGIANWLSSLVYQVSPHSPWMIAGAMLAVITTACFAAAIPLWRAFSSDVITYIREF